MILHLRHVSRCIFRVPFLVPFCFLWHAFSFHFPHSLPFLCSVGVCINDWKLPASLFNRDYNIIIILVLALLYLCTFDSPLPHIFFLTHIPHIPAQLASQFLWVQKSNLAWEPIAGELFCDGGKGQLHLSWLHFSFEKEVETDLHPLHMAFWTGTECSERLFQRTLSFLQIQEKWFIYLIFID